MCKSTESLSLLSQITSVDLYLKLIEQLNKDFQLAGIQQSFSLNSTSTELIQELQKTIIKLINYDFEGYLNLLYRVDLSENKIKKLSGSDIDKMSEQVAYLLLKREWQKVWFKSRL